MDKAYHYLQSQKFVDSILRLSFQADEQVIWCESITDTI